MGEEAEVGRRAQIPREGVGTEDETTNHTNHTNGFRAGGPIKSMMKAFDLFISKIRVIRG